MAHSANPGSTAAQVELRRQAAQLIITFLLVVLSVVALFAPGWGVMPGLMLGGGTTVTLNLSATDGSELEQDQISTALSTLKARAAALWEYDVEVASAGDAAVSVRVPSMYDAQTVASSLVGTGHVEFVSQLDISDADELELLTSGSSDVTLAADTYTAFMSSSNITAAKVVNSGSGSSMVYAVQVTLDDQGESAFSAETEELASSYGVIAVVLDGEVIATPYVSSKIEGNEVTISGGFTRDEAYALAAKLSSGELGVEAEVGESSTFEDVCGGLAPWVAVLVLAALCVVASVFLAKAFGGAGWLAGPSLFATAVCGLGILAVLALFGHVILGKWELVAGVVVAAASLAASALAAQTYHKERLASASVRKSQQIAEAAMMSLERIYVVVVVAALVATFFIAGGAAEFAWALAGGLAAEVVLAWLFKQPVLCVVTAPDTAEAELVGAKPQKAAKAVKAKDAAQSTSSKSSD